ncbi:hypothetical protein LOD99_7149 [Oopsacas minuta]|uniref:Uncharacterized protein n=1 Tax=Oopsacas minuta TaxID=111878 RepID=A0AAV7JJ00_9METZ|nr:hypothetical protein LOD99_7149 [Oopsacas minuta]
MKKKHTDTDEEMRSKNLNNGKGAKNNKLRRIGKSNPCEVSHNVLSCGHNSCEENASGSSDLDCSGDKSEHAEGESRDGDCGGFSV